MKINTYLNKESKINSLDFIKDFEMNDKTHTQPYQNSLGIRKSSTNEKISNDTPTQ